MLAAGTDPAPIASAPEPRRNRAAQPAILLTIGIAFLWCLQRAFAFVSVTLSTRFAAYDDEGYLLVSVREFLAGSALYSEVFSQYGPAYYAYKHLLAIVQGVPTHDVSRQATVFMWIVAAVLLGWTGLWLTRNGLAAVAVFCAASVAMWPMGSEPGHPQELAVALTALSVAVAATPLTLPLRATLLAAVAALAGLTKINVGTFVGLATVTMVLPLMAGTPRLIYALVLGALPFLVMVANLGTWAWPYALASSAAIVTAVVMTAEAGTGVSSVRKAAPILAGLLLPVAALVIYVISRGTTLGALVDGILLRPARTNNLIVNPLQLPTGFLALSLVSAGAAVYVSQCRSALLLRFASLLPLFRVAVGLYVVFWGAKNPPEIIAGSAVIVLALVLPRSDDGTDSFGRAFLALSAALHTMTAYPVAGSQITWSSLLLIVAAFVCLWDGLTALRPAAVEVPALSRVIATAFVSVGLVVWYASQTPVTAWRATAQSLSPLPFAGATSIRLGHAQVATYNWLTQNLQGHCSAFLTLPGFNSLYAWSGIRPPTGYNNSAWMLLLNDAEQARTLARMREASRPCAVTNPGGFNWWTTRPLSGPVVDYMTGLSPVASSGGYEIRMPANLVATWQFDYLQFGSRSYTGADVSPVPVEALTAPTLRLWFKAVGGGGTLVGAQSTTTQQTPPTGWCPMVYLGNDGRLRAELWNGAHAPIATAQRMDDQQWHHMVLVKRADRQQLYVDGAFVGQIAGPAPADWAAFMQLGTGFTYLWPETNGSWFPFRGELRDVIVARRAWEADEVSRDFLESRSVPTGSHTTSP